MDELIALGRHGATASLVTRDGEVVERAHNILLLFRPAWSDHPLLQRPDVKVFDLAELWALVRPGQNAPPTVQGMTGESPENAEESAFYLYKLMDDLMAEAQMQMRDLEPFLNWLGSAEPLYRWPWLDRIATDIRADSILDVTDLVKGIAKWSLPPDFRAHDPMPVQRFRPDQARYYEALKEFLDAPHAAKTMLAVGGTGVGKTRAYLAAAAGHGDNVWVSTFTRALQRQVQSEAQTHLNIPAHIRKGRDNYLCLKLLKEAWDRAPHWADGRLRVGLILMLRWLQVTPDGDMTGGSFPGWLLTLFGPLVTQDLTDRKKECNYNGCLFYSQCFAERARAWSADAPLVVANHAVVAGLVARGAMGGGGFPSTLIMDEAHHVENVADDTLTGGISVVSATELGRLLLGTPAGERRRGRKGFLDTLADTLPDADRPLVNEAAKAAVILPVMNALDRIRNGQAIGPLEGWLAQLWRVIDTDVAETDKKSGYDWDIARAHVPPADPDLIKVVTRLCNALQAILYRMEHYDREASLLENEVVFDPMRDVLANCILPLRLWLTQWSQLDSALDPAHVEWASIKREDGQIRDVGLYRAWLDPLSVWKTITESHLDATVYTTATPTKSLLTLQDIAKVSADSPFDYPVQSRVLVLTDVDNMNERAMASALTALFETSGGGALAVFTAIARLRRVYDLMTPLCDRANLHVLAQHVDPMDVATLIDLFRTEPRCVMLGTDAIRDGVDIPGDALRLLVFDRVPWPRPDLLHKARRDAHGGRHYDEDMVRLKLKQAFGRLIRTETDKGVFVMLDSRLPSRLYDAFPEGVRIDRMNLVDALAELRQFFDNQPGVIAA